MLNSSLQMVKEFEQVIISGGDHRTIVSEASNHNVYGCAPSPISALHYSSSTASNVTFGAFNFARDIYQRIIDQREDIIEFVERENQITRDSIRSLFGLPDNVDIVLCPSGTDTELLAITIIANVTSKKINSILLAPQEVGSGVENAASGRAPSDITPFGNKIEKGSLIEGFEKINLQVSPIDIRELTGEGELKDRVHDKILKLLHSNLLNNCHTLLHMVYRSKTGAVAPSVEFVRSIRCLYRRDVDVVVDACQMRMKLELLRELLSMGCMVIITGSKFFTGAPFSSALLVPNNLRDIMNENAFVPKGIKEYISQYDIPIRWKSRYKFNKMRFNIGLLLRWKTALYEMTRYFAIQEQRIEQIVSVFSELLAQIINKYENLDLMEVDYVCSTMVYDSNYYQDTIKTINIRSESGWICYEDAKVVYEAMRIDLSSLSVMSEEDRSVLSKICYIGQPVKIYRDTNRGWIGSLRIALGAAQISSLAGEVKEKQQRSLKNDINILLQKMSIIARHIEECSLICCND